MAILALAVGITIGYLLGRLEKRHVKVVMRQLNAIKEDLTKEKVSITSPSKVYRQKTALMGLQDETDISKY